MIYQLKITLEGMHPPTWVRLQVNSEATFDELNDYIQDAFEWDDEQLHRFDVPDLPEIEEVEDTLSGIAPMKGNTSQWNKIQIGPTEDDPGPFGDNFLDESECIISDYLRQAKDKATYI